MPQKIEALLAVSDDRKIEKALKAAPCSKSGLRGSPDQLAAPANESFQVLVILPRLPATRKIWPLAINGMRDTVFLVTPLLA
jgi:hypothetical protein